MGGKKINNQEEQNQGTRDLVDVATDPEASEVDDVYEGGAGETGPETANDGKCNTPF